MILPNIRDVLQEQHSQDEVFVGVGADGATKGITGSPKGFVDAVLIDFLIAAHGYFVFLFLSGFCCRRFIVRYICNTVVWSESQQVFCDSAHHLLTILN